MERTEMLRIIAYNKIVEETFTREKREEKLVVVVKNSPFSLELEVVKIEDSLQRPPRHVQQTFLPSQLYPYNLTSPIKTEPPSRGRSLDSSITSLSLDCRLYYDTNPLKEVDYLYSSPIDFRIIPSANSSRFTVEFKIKILTSHREDMLFRIGIQMIDNTTNKPFENMFCISMPIKVLSKTEQSKKTKKDSQDLDIHSQIISATAHVPVRVGIMPLNKKAKTGSTGMTLQLSKMPTPSSQDKPSAEMDTELNIQELCAKALTSLAAMEEEERSQLSELMTVINNQEKALPQSPQSPQSPQINITDFASSSLSNFPSQSPFSSFVAPSKSESLSFLKQSYHENKRFKDSKEPNLLDAFTCTLKKICEEFRDSSPSEKADLISELSFKFSEDEIIKFQEFRTFLETVGILAHWNATFMNEFLS